MAIVNQKDSRTGITYVYESVSKWVPEKKQSRSVRKCIGKRDPKTGEIIPTRGRGKKGESLKAKGSKPTGGPKSITETKHLYYGATYLLDVFMEQIGLQQDLKTCFPDLYKQIISLAYYIMLESDSPLYRFEKWSQIHKHPYGENIPSPRSSELIASITDEQINQFFKLQGKRRIKEEYWAYDSTSISSYSETLKQAQYGKNKEGDILPQINLLLVYGEKSGLPFYYRKLSGNIPDSKTVRLLLKSINTLGFEGTKFVMDRGFFKKANIDEFFKNCIKFLIGMKMSLLFVRKNLEGVYDKIRMFNNLLPDTEIYGIRVLAEWECQETKRDGSKIKTSKRIYVYYYYDIERASNDECEFMQKMKRYFEELKTDNLVESHRSDYEKYFKVKETPARGKQISFNEEEMQKARKYFGYFALSSNEKMSPEDALYIYRHKDVVEKAFGNLKDRLDCRRLKVSTEKTLDGKLFVQFIALILISYLKQRMKDGGLLGSYSIPQLLDKLDVIECFEAPGHRMYVGEILEKQRDIYQALGVKVPTSSR